MIENHKYFHWLYYTKGKKHFFNLGLGLFLWLFLAITQGFGIYNNNLSSTFLLLLFLLSFGLIWVAVAYSTDYLATRIFSLPLNVNPKIDFIFWIIKLFLLVHASFVYRNYLCDWTCMDLHEYLELWLAIILMFLLFYIPYSIYARFLFFKNIVGTNRSELGLFELIGEGKKSLKVDLDSIAYFQADDNYVDIISLTKEMKERKLVLRVTIKNLTNQLKTQNQFIRVHRKYIVNLRYATNLEKEQITMSLGESSIEIPVSQKYQEEISRLLN